MSDLLSALWRRDRVVTRLLFWLASAFTLLSAPTTVLAQSAAEFCAYSPSNRVLTGRIDDNGSQDALCLDRVSGSMRVGLRSGARLSMAWERPNTLWCTHAGAEAHLADVNGDGHADLICRDSTRLWIDTFESDLFDVPRYYQGNHQTQDTRWCTHAGTVFLGFADENRDGRADMGCRDSNGYFWVGHADPAGRFAGTSAEGFSPDLRLTRAIRTATTSTAATYSITIVNNSPVPGLVLELGCRGPIEPHFTSVDGGVLPRWIAGFGSLTLSLNHSLAGPQSVICSVRGSGEYGSPELIVSNNSIVPTPY